MERGMFLVQREGEFFGPFLRHEADHFLSAHSNADALAPLRVMWPSDRAPDPLKLSLLEADVYRAHVDSIKVDTKPVLAGLIQTIFYAREEERVLTAQELLDVWGRLLRVSRAVEGLMHYAEQAIADPTPERLTALRLSLWRNRDSDDVDEHYADRFW